MRKTIQYTKVDGDKLPTRQSIIDAFPTLYVIEDNILLEKNTLVLTDEKPVEKALQDISATQVSMQEAINSLLGV